MTRTDTLSLTGIPTEEEEEEEEEEEKQQEPTVGGDMY